MELNTRPHPISILSIIKKGNYREGTTVQITAHLIEDQSKARCSIWRILRKNAHNTPLLWHLRALGLLMSCSAAHAYRIQWAYSRVIDLTELGSSVYGLAYLKS